MQYTIIDYNVLCALHNRKTELESLLEAASSTFPYPITQSALAFSLGKLATGGYIDGYSLTEKGKAFFKDHKKFLESKAKANARLCALLCAEKAYPSTPYALSNSEYVQAFEAIRHKRDVIIPDLSITEGGASLVLNIENYTVDEDGNLHGTDPIEMNTDSLCAFAQALNAYIQDDKHHKCCLYTNRTPAYIATIGHNDNLTRLHIEKILYNRHRFIGKCDSDLDYAQCGDSVYDRSSDKLHVLLKYLILQSEMLLQEDFPYDQTSNWEI